jgi:hypothetical protein
MFDEILSLNFDLRPLKWRTTHYTWINFIKDYQKDSYNKTHLMGKHLKG